MPAFICRVVIEYFMQVLTGIEGCDGKRVLSECPRRELASQLEFAVLEVSARLPGPHDLNPCDPVLPSPLARPGRTTSCESRAGDEFLVRDGQC